MKKVFLSLLMLCALFAQAAEIERIEPACWWVDMKNPELQIMVYGKNAPTFLPLTEDVSIRPIYFPVLSFAFSSDGTTMI